MEQNVEAPQEADSVVPLSRYVLLGSSGVLIGLATNGLVFGLWFHFVGDPAADGKVAVSDAWSTVAGWGAFVASVVGLLLWVRNATVEAPAKPVPAWIRAPLLVVTVPLGVVVAAQAINLPPLHEPVGDLGLGGLVPWAYAIIGGAIAATVYTAAFPRWVRFRYWLWEPLLGCVGVGVLAALWGTM